MNTEIRVAGRSTFGRFKSLAGLDADVLHTFTFRSWSIVAGGATVILVPLFLSGMEQGYYYTFASLLGLQVFFELGLSQVILQLVSHGLAEGEGPGREKVRSLVALLRRWYAIAATAFFFVVSAAGAWFLARQSLLAPAAWLGPWMSLAFATAVNLYLSALLAVLEGGGEVAAVARLRFRQSVVGYAGMWLALAAGAGLWATVLPPLASALGSASWLRASAPSFHHLLATSIRGSAGTGSTTQWRRDVFPLQWRIALSWVSGYFIVHLFAPLTFAHQGAVEAGRLGITLTVFNGVLTAGMSWVNAKFPTLAGHLARNERASANALFRRVAARSLAFTAVVSGVVLLVLSVLEILAPVIAQRFASMPVAACIAIATLANTFIFAAAAYLRAHKEEPMLLPSLASGLMIGLAVSAGSLAGVLPMMALYLGVTLLVSLPWTWVLFRGYFQRV